MGTMKAILYHGPKKSVSIESIPVPEPGEGDILVRTKCASLCHSDFNLLDGTNPAPVLPITPGHEGSGVVERVGPGVTDFQVGDEVGFLLYYHPCGHCQACKSGNPTVCPKNKMQGFTMNGYFAEYCLVDSKSAMKLPTGMDVTQAAPLFCAGLTAFYAINKCGLEAGQWIAIIGIGGLGHLGNESIGKALLHVVIMIFGGAALAVNLSGIVLFVFGKRYGSFWHRHNVMQKLHIRTHPE